MPQGSPKKIEVDLLLTDLALQLGDLAARRLRLIRLALPGPRPRAQRLRLARPAGAAHRLRSALLVLAVPLVQPPAVHPDRPGHRRHCLAIRHPGDRRALLFFREISMLLHPVPLYEKLSAVSCLTFGGRYIAKPLTPPRRRSGRGRDRRRRTRSSRTRTSPRRGRSCRAGRRAPRA